MSAPRCDRRAFVGASLLFPFGVSGWTGCGPRQPDTPLAHLYGKEWVQGAYAHYAQSYLALETGTRARSFDVYKVLAQKGVTALEGLQRREVPFLLRLSEDGRRYEIRREVPERLTFSANMTAEEREEATRVWKLAREHVHTDYAEIARLNWSMTELLGGVTVVRNAIDQGTIESYRLCRRLTELKAGGELPFQLPYQVTRQDYQRVLFLLLDRLQGDHGRLGALESSMLAVGLTARATDAGSASLGANVEKVLLAVVEDAEAAEGAPPAKFPESDEERDRRLQHGVELHAGIVATAEYQAWLKAERRREDQIGQFLSLLDQVTGLPTSALYRQAMSLWNGDADYLDYLKLAAALVPGGGGLRGVLDEAVETTVKARDLYAKARTVKSVADAAASGDAASALGAIEGAGLVNTATRHAKRSIPKQLVFLKARDEVDAVKRRLGETKLLKDPMPELPATPATPEPGSPAT
jgi:hypothetical protein